MASFDKKTLYTNHKHKQNTFVKTVIRILSMNYHIAHIKFNNYKT